MRKSSIIVSILRNFRRLAGENEKVFMGKSARSAHFSCLSRKSRYSYLGRRSVNIVFEKGTAIPFSLKLRTVFASDLDVFLVFYLEKIIEQPVTALPLERGHPESKTYVTDEEVFIWSPARLP